MYCYLWYIHDIFGYLYLNIVKINTIFLTKTYISPIKV